MDAFNKNNKEIKLKEEDVRECAARVLTLIRKYGTVEQ